MCVYVCVHVYGACIYMCVSVCVCVCMCVCRPSYDGSYAAPLRLISLLNARTLACRIVSHACDFFRFRVPGSRAAAAACSVALGESFQLFVRRL